MRLAPERLREEPVLRARARRRSRASSPCATRPTRSATWCGTCSRTARPASRSASRRCCSAPAHHSGRLELELAAATSPSSSSAGSSSSRPRTSRTCSRCCASPRTRAIGWPASGCSSCCPAIGPGTARKALGAPRGRRLRVRGARRRCSRRRRAPSGGRLWSSSCAPSRPARRWPGSSSWSAPSTIRFSRSCTITSRARLADLDELARIAGGYPSRERFLTELALDPPAAAGAEAGVPLRDEDYLILSTIHSAKGREWKAVFVLNLADGCIPSDMATGSGEEIEEERRVLYVAMTRARDQLHLIHPRRFYTTGSRRSATATSTRRAAASFPRRCSICSSTGSWASSATAGGHGPSPAGAAEGRRRRPAARHVALSRGAARCGCGSALLADHGAGADRDRPRLRPAGLIPHLQDVGLAPGARRPIDEQAARRPGEPPAAP